MRRSGQIAAVALVSIVGAGCHKKTPSIAPPTPLSAPAQTEQNPQPPHPRTTHSPATSPSAEPAQPQPAQPQPQFRLGQALTPEELRANNALIDRHLQQANQVLASMGNRQLNNEQKSSVAQIRGFMEQARQMRATDVLRARSLAERADVLAQDLLSRLK